MGATGMPRMPSRPGALLQTRRIPQAARDNRDAWRPRHDDAPARCPAGAAAWPVTSPACGGAAGEDGRPAAPPARQAGERHAEQPQRHPAQRRAVGARRGQRQHGDGAEEQGAQQALQQARIDAGRGCGIAHAGQAAWRSSWRRSSGREDSLARGASQGLRPWRLQEWRSRIGSAAAEKRRDQIPVCRSGFSRELLSCVCRAMEVAMLHR